MLLKTLKGNSRYIWCVSFSPDGLLLAYANCDFDDLLNCYVTIKLLDVNSGRLINILKGHSCCVHSMSFSPDGELLASVSLNTINLWDIRSGTLLITMYGHKNAVMSVG